MYPGKDQDEVKAQISQITAREVVDLIDKWIACRILSAVVDGKNRDEKIELIKRQITDYLLVTDPRQGVFFQDDKL